MADAGLDRLSHPPGLRRQPCPRVRDADVSDDRDFKDHAPIELVSAEADFSQNKFSPEGALSAKAKSGWAISPRMGKSHLITFYCKQPLKLDETPLDGERLRRVWPAAF